MNRLRRVTEELDRRRGKAPLTLHDILDLTAMAMGFTHLISTPFDDIPRRAAALLDEAERTDRLVHKQHERIKDLEALLAKWQEHRGVPIDLVAEYSRLMSTARGDE